MPCIFKMVDMTIKGTIVSDALCCSIYVVRFKI